MNKKVFHELHPGAFFLDGDDAPALGNYLAGTGRLVWEEDVAAVAKAGEGNMNCVVRVCTTTGRSFILKQARDWVEKYPRLAAPRNRALVEARFYAVTAGTPAVAGMMPRVLWLDADARLLALEDLGAASDFFPIYAGGSALDLSCLDALVAYLSALHRLVPPAGDDALLANREMRALNHEHIFSLPLRSENGIDLDRITPGLAGAAAALQADAAYSRAVHALGERYLADDAGALLHGDFFPGSWLRTGDGAVRVIDPEFSFRGDAEFDVGVMLAHLRLAQQPEPVADRLLARYQPARERDFSLERMRGYEGVEIMRRLLGVAQLPLGPHIDLQRKTALLEESRRLVLGAAGA